MMIPCGTSRSLGVLTLGAAGAPGGRPTANDPAPPSPLPSHRVRRSFAGDERALVLALRANHPGAKAAFFERYARVLERIITHVLGFDAELTDVRQEAFAAALTSLHRLQEPAALELWLSRIAANTARKVLRSRARRRWLRRFVDSAEEARCEPAGTGVDVVARQALRGVYTTLHRLPANERTAFALRFIDGMELTEVASACEVSLATIKRRLASARRHFFANAKHQPELAQWLQEAPRWSVH